MFLLRKHPRIFTVNLLFLGLLLMAIFIASRHEGRHIYEIDPKARAILVLDIGHGGRDPGAVVSVPDHGGGPPLKIYEHAMVFDVGARIARELKSRNDISIIPLVLNYEDKLPLSELSYPLPPRRVHLRSTPSAYLDDLGASFAVNLRWILANEIYLQASKGSIAEIPVIFLSLHMDYVPNRGAGLTIYLPSGSAELSIDLREELFRAYREARDWFMAEKNLIQRSSQDRESSMRLSDQIIMSFQEYDLPIRHERPVRTLVGQGNGAYVPAVIKYNEIPTRLLLEMLNLEDEEDRRFVADPLNRERLAKAIVDALLAYLSVLDS